MSLGSLSSSTHFLVEGDYLERRVGWPSDNWEVPSSFVSLHLLPRLISNHPHILLDHVDVKLGESSFIMENMCLKVEGFGDLVKCW